jgi:hypothetical protein
MTLIALDLDSCLYKHLAVALPEIREQARVRCWARLVLPSDGVLCHVCSRRLPDVVRVVDRDGHAGSRTRTRSCRCCRSSRLEAHAHDGHYDGEKLEES